MIIYVFDRDGLASLPTRLGGRCPPFTVLLVMRHANQISKKRGGGRVKSYNGEAGEVR